MKAYIPLFIAMFLLSACNRNNEKQTEIIKPVKYEKIAYQNSKHTHTFSGIVKSEYETKLSFKVGGTLNSVNVKLGDKVKKGQLIAGIDPIDYEIQKEQVTAQKKSSESQLIMAQSTFVRVEKLYENNSVALSEYEKAKANLASAQSQFKATGKQLEAAKNQIAYTQLYAPMNGVITTLAVESNEIVGSGRIIAVLSSEGKPEIEVGVPEALISKLIKGQAVGIEFPSIVNNNFNGKIEKIAFAPGQSSTYPVIVSITNPLSEIRPGMAAEVSFNGETTNGNQQSKIVAPIEAVGKNANGNFVFVLHKATDAQYLVEKRPVLIGEMFPKGFEVINGLEENELVATAGLTFLRDSMKVKLLENN